jgi:hypothetical protein
MDGKKLFRRSPKNGEWGTAVWTSIVRRVSKPLDNAGMAKDVGGMAGETDGILILMGPLCGICEVVESAAANSTVLPVLVIFQPQRIHEREELRRELRIVEAVRMRFCAGMKHVAVAPLVAENGFSRLSIEVLADGTTEEVPLAQVLNIFRDTRVLRIDNAFRTGLDGVNDVVAD